MKKNEIKYYSITILLLIILFIVEYSKPRPVDWRETYDYSHKIPYGSFVFRQTLEDIFPSSEIYENKNTVYEFYNSNPKKKRNYIFLTFSFDIDNNEIKTLNKLVQEGNNVFIAAEHISDSLSSSLNVEYDYSFSLKSNDDSIIFTNKNFNKKNFRFNTDKINFNVFNSFDSAKYIVLAENHKGNPVFLRKKYNEGNFFLISSPAIFTNYSMITLKNYQAAYNALSYLPDYDIVLCDYYKPYKQENRSVFKYIFQNPNLRNAYNVFFVSFIIYFLFNIKRRQRIIPVLKPLRNTTLDFVYTLGRLYYKSKNNKDIVLKKFKYFNDYLTTKYYLSFFDAEDKDIELISEKTGVDANIVEALRAAQRNINKVENISDQQLLLLNKNFEEFYKTAK